MPSGLLTMFQTEGILLNTMDFSCSMGRSLLVLFAIGFDSLEQCVWVTARQASARPARCAVEVCSGRFNFVLNPHHAASGMGELDVSNAIVRGLGGIGR